MNGIPLDEFIADTLFSVVTGITKAQSRVRDHEGDAIVSPRISKSLSDSNPNVPLYSANGKAIEHLHFDIAVTASTETSKKKNAGIGLSVLAMGIGGAKGSTKQALESVVSRIQFSVPVQLPNHET